MVKGKEKKTRPGRALGKDKDTRMAGQRKRVDWTHREPGGEEKNEGAWEGPTALGRRAGKGQNSGKNSATKPTRCAETRSQSSETYLGRNQQDTENGKKKAGRKGRREGKGGGVGGGGGGGDVGGVGGVVRADEKTLLRRSNTKIWKEGDHRKKNRPEERKKKKQKKRVIVHNSEGKPRQGGVEHKNNQKGKGKTDCCSCA